MEVPGAGRNKFFVLWSEMIGTAFVLLAVNWGGTSSHTPICVGLTVAVMIQMYGSISGGHFNPAVTVGMMIKHKHDDLPFGIVYGQVMMLFQFVGAWLGCLLCAGAMVFLPQDDKTLPVPGSHYITQLCPRNGCNDGGKMVFKVFLVEGVMTFFFVCFVLQIVKHNGAKETPVNGLAIGLALYAAIQIASGISGGCINPAVGLVQTVFQRLFNGHAYPNAPPQQLMYMPIYLISPFIGGMVAGFFQRVFVGIAYDRAEKAAANAAE
jgi:glycerol uptake facilitator-like aquaporin